MALTKISSSLFLRLVYIVAQFHQYELISETHITGKIGETVNLRCSNHENTQQGQWINSNLDLVYADRLHINTQLPNKDRLRIVGQDGEYNLQIKGIVLSDAGKYRCILKKGGKATYTDVLLIVIVDDVTEANIWQSSDISTADSSTFQPYVDFRSRMIYSFVSVAGICIFVVCTIAIVKLVLRKRLHLKNYNTEVQAQISINDFSEDENDAYERVDDCMSENLALNLRTDLENVASLCVGASGNTDETNYDNTDVKEINSFSDGASNYQELQQYRGSTQNVYEKLQ